MQLQNKEARAEGDGDSRETKIPCVLAAAVPSRASMSGQKRLFPLTPPAEAPRSHQRGVQCTHLTLEMILVLASNPGKALQLSCGKNEYVLDHGRDGVRYPKGNRMVLTLRSVSMASRNGDLFFSRESVDCPKKMSVTMSS